MLISCIFGIIFFAIEEQYFGVMFLFWIVAYLCFWLFLGLMIHVTANELFATKNDFYIIQPTVGDRMVVFTGGQKYKKVGSARPQVYTVADSKERDIDSVTGIVYSANETDKTMELHEIDIIDQVGNVLFIRGYLGYNESDKNYYNNLDTSSLSEQVSLLSLQLKTTMKAKEGTEKLYESASNLLAKEREESLRREGKYAGQFADTLEQTNVVTGEYSGTTTALENRRVDAKLGSEKKVKEMVEEEVRRIKSNMLLEQKGK